MARTRRTLRLRGDGFDRLATRSGGLLGMPGRSPRRKRGAVRLDGFEKMEPRCLLASDPLHAGAAFVDPDVGADAQGETFEVRLQERAELARDGAERRVDAANDEARPLAGESLEGESLELSEAQDLTPEPPGPPLPESELAPLPPLPDEAPPVRIELPPVPPQPIAPPLLELPQYGSGAFVAAGWHLSVIEDGSSPSRSSVETGGEPWQTVVQVATTDWSSVPLQQGEWVLPAAKADDMPASLERAGLPAGTSSVAEAASFEQFLFGMPGAIPVSGDFDGDGDSDLGIFHEGQWYLDVNGNGRWDSGDLCVELGGKTDTPITGDWNGDGKDDIGVFGTAWPDEQRVSRAEAEMPDSRDSDPPHAAVVASRPHESAKRQQLLSQTSAGVPRGEFIDQVLRFGRRDDFPVSGDWNGDGLDTIGLFRDGRWHLDRDGDGRWTSADEMAWFGAPGDRPVVGDFNGDGVDDLGVYRQGQWHLDSDGDRKLTPHDKVFELGGPLDTPVVGDFHGDGIDEPGLYRAVVAAGE